MAKLTSFTFRDTGITVMIKKVSPLLAADIAAAFPAPLPPEQEVDYGAPVGKVMEPNPADPAYAVALQEYRQKLYEIIQRVMILRGVEIQGESWKEEVREYREMIKQYAGGDLQEPEDKVVYILRICVGTQDDMNELIREITRRSQPTEEAIEAAKDSFRSQA